EDVTLTFSSSNFTFADPNDNPATGGGPADIFANLIITQLPASGGNLFVGATQLNAGNLATLGIIPVGSINTLTFVPNGQNSGLPLSTFSFKVQDGGSTATVIGSGLSNSGVNTSTATYTMSLNVLPVADAPVAISAPKTTILEDNSYTFSAADFA